MIQRRHKKKLTIPLAVVAGFIPAATEIQKTWSFFGGPGAIMHTTAGLIGYDTYSNEYRGLARMKEAGTYGIIAGLGVHWIASKLGVNRALGRAGIPLLRI